MIYRTLGNDEMCGYLTSSGFEVMKISEREPYELEYPTRRVYITAKKTATGD